MLTTCLLLAMWVIAPALLALACDAVVLGNVPERRHLQWRSLVAGFVFGLAAVAALALACAHREVWPFVSPVPVASFAVVAAFFFGWVAGVIATVAVAAGFLALPFLALAPISGSFVDAVCAFALGLFATAFARFPLRSIRPGPCAAAVMAIVVATVMPAIESIVAPGAAFAFSPEALRPLVRTAAVIVAASASVAVACRSWRGQGLFSFSFLAAVFYAAIIAATAIVCMWGAASRTERSLERAAGDFVNVAVRTMASVAPVAATNAAPATADFCARFPALVRTLRPAETGYYVCSDVTGGVRVAVSNAEHPESVGCTLASIGIESPVPGGRTVEASVYGERSRVRRFVCGSRDVYAVIPESAFFSVAARIISFLVLSLLTVLALFGLLLAALIDAGRRAASLAAEKDALFKLVTHRDSVAPAAPPPEAAEAPPPAADDNAEEAKAEP